MITKLRIFISSPGDVSEERALAAQVFERLSREFSEAVELEVVLWEHEPLFGHAHFQEQIERPSQCDLVVCILWSRLGTRLPSNYVMAPGEAPPTGTEFEVRDALEAYKRLGKPNLLIYRKTAPPQVNLASSDARERLAQYELLEDFCRRAFYDEQGEVLVAHRFYAEAYEFERLLTEHARRWLERQVGELVGRPRWTLGSPYRGLQVFETEHRVIYFGRSQAISELTKRMREAEARPRDGAPVTRFLMVQGMSGNGKSSLIRAGLLPLLEGRAIEGIGLWRHVTCRPSDRSAKHADAGVLGGLTEGLLRALPTLSESYPNDGEIAERLRMEPAASAARLDGYLAQEAIRSGLKPDQIRLVVFIDQLEELFGSGVSNGERVAVVETLRALAAEGRIWVIATLRSDFVPRLEEQMELVNLTREGHVYLLGSPRNDELADMIREPANAAGLEWESRDGVSLDQAILREATESPESLPLLEYALDRLYEKRDGRRLTYVAYDQLGGFKGGIAATAEAVLTAQQYTPDTFSTLMRTLVSVDEKGTPMRRYAVLAAFLHSSAERELLDALIERRLCVTDRLGEEAVVKLAHEVLLRNWPQLMQWLATEKSLLQARETVEREARVWHERGRSKDWLATTADKIAMHRRLVQAGVTLPTPAGEFIVQSRARVDRNVWVKRATIAGLALLAVAATVFAAMAARQRDAVQNGLSRYFAFRAWEGIGNGHTAQASRYAFAAYDAARPRGTGLQQLFARIALVDTGGVVLAGHQSGLFSASFSADGKRVVTAGADHTARVWDATSGRELARLVQKGEVSSAAFSLDGTRVVTVSKDRSVRVWDAASGLELARLASEDEIDSAAFSPDGARVLVLSHQIMRMLDVASGRELNLLQHEDFVFSASFSPDGTQIVIVSAADDTVHVLDIAHGLKHGQLVSKPKPHSTIYSASFTPDGAKVLAISDDNTAYVWDATSGRQLARLEQKGNVSSAEFSPDGTRVVTVSIWDDTERVWDAASGRELARHPRIFERALQASFSPDGTRVMSLSMFGVMVWDAATGRELAHLTHKYPVDSAAFSPDGTRVVTVSKDNTAHVWDADNGRELERLVHIGDVVSAKFSPDGTRVVTASDDTTARVWDIAATPVLAQLAHDYVNSAKFSPDGTRVVTVSNDNTAYVWDATSGRQLARLALEGEISSAEFSPDGTRVVTASQDKTARVWDAANGRELARFVHEDTVRGASFSADGRKVVTASSNTARLWDTTTTRELARLVQEDEADRDIKRTSFSADGTRLLTVSTSVVQLWDVASGRALARLAHDYGICGAEFSPDGTKVVTATTPGPALVWDVASGRALRWWPAGDCAIVRASFSPDGTRIVMASSVWDVASGRELARFAQDGEVSSAEFSPDGTRVVTASKDKSARVWDAANGRELARFLHEGAVHGASFSPDGTKLITVSSNAARVWSVLRLDVELPDAAAQLCRSPTLFPRNSTNAELLGDQLLWQISSAQSAVDRVCAELHPDGWVRKLDSVVHSR